MTRVTGSKIHLQHLPEYDDFDPDLDIDAPAGYAVEAKNLPQQPTQHPTKPGTIKWFNAFGIKKNNAYTDVSYTVTMQKLPQGKELYYLILSGPQLIPADQIHDAGTNDKGKPTVRFTLRVGDPPVGSYP